MNTTSEVIRVKEAFAWVEAGKAVHLKAATADGKPVVLSAEETRKLAERLLKLAQTVESLQANRPDDDEEA
jgi:MinD-like ATPase involved in chromosome partitioning or flagellar assembly